MMPFGVGDRDPACRKRWREALGAEKIGKTSGKSSERWA